MQLFCYKCTRQTVEGNTCYSSGVKTGFKGLMVTCGGRLGPPHLELMMEVTVE